MADPQTLGGRTIAVLLVGLGLFHLWSIWIYQVGIENLLGSTRDQQLAERLVSVKRAIAALPSGDREQTAHALSTATMEIHWSPLSLVNPPSVESERISLLRRRLRSWSRRSPTIKCVSPSPTRGQTRENRRVSPSSPRVGAVARCELGQLQARDISNRAAGARHACVAVRDGPRHSPVSFVLVRSLTAPLRTLASRPTASGSTSRLPKCRRRGRARSSSGRGLQPHADADQTPDQRPDANPGRGFA